ncbi:MAG TPA: methyltransferase domain-containing protein [Polyangiaceae bacterium]|jgi:SAM-dependent methyltransferase
MSATDYLFDDAAAASELARLRALQEIFDPHTQRLLSATGDWAKRRCLEVGAGAGSIALWMRMQVGAGGRVVAVDSNTRFLAGMQAELEIIEGDVREAALPAAAFDVVHARYVLIHNADSNAVLDAIVRCLEPGAWLLLEEPDFLAAESLAGPAELRSAFDNVNRAIAASFANRAMDPGLGRRLPALVQARTLELQQVECVPCLEQGGSPLARMMTLSATALREKYVATGLATQADVDGYCAFAADAACWGVYYSTLRVLARAVVHPK